MTRHGSAGIWLSILAIVTTLSLIALLLLGDRSAAQAVPEDEAPRATRARNVVVRAGQVLEASSSKELRFPATLRAPRSASMAFSIPGRIVKVEVKLGQEITKGQVLARIDSAQLRNNRSAAEADRTRIRAQLDDSKRQVERASSLREKNTISQADFERSESGYKVLDAAEVAAEVRVRESRRMLADSTLRAPFDGTVTQVFQDPGEFVGPGTPVVSINSKGANEIEVELPENLISGLEVGTDISVEFPLRTHERVPGKIARIGSATVGFGRLFPIVVELEPRPDLLPGMAADLILTRPTAAGSSVPVEAVINPGGQHPGVFLVEDGKARYIEVAVEGITKGRVLVRGPLRSGQSVIIGGHSGLSDGDEVTIK